MTDENNIPPPKKPHRFQIGNSFGKGFIGAGVMEARKLNKKKAEELLNKFISMPFGELIAFCKENNPKTGKCKDSSIEVLIATILMMAIKEGDDRRLNFIFERLIGKVVDKVEVALPKPTVIRLRGQEAETIVLGGEAVEEAITKDEES